MPIGGEGIPDPRDRALANRLVTTALRRHGHLNLVVHHLLDRGMPKKSGSFEAILRLSLTQLLYLPELGAHSALFLAVEAAKRDQRAAHLSGLVNALLRRAQGERETLLEAPLDLLFPDWLKKTWTRTYGGRAVEGFGAALIEGAELDLTLKSPDKALIEALGGVLLLPDSVRIRSRDRSVEALPGYEGGLWWVQDAAASLPARLLQVAPGARVLDLCAAPGGKTAQLLNAGFKVSALDNDVGRIERMQANFARLGYAPEIITGDARHYVPETAFEGVLLDAPCSATGTFRRHPEVVWHREAAGVAGRVGLQRKLIANALSCLAPGGILIYSVCSLEPEEGEEQAHWALKTLPGIEPLPIAGDELAGLEGAVGAEGFVRTYPGMAAPGSGGGTLDGFFIARFRRALAP